MTSSIVGSSHPCSPILNAHETSWPRGSTMPGPAWSLRSGSASAHCSTATSTNAPARWRGTVCAALSMNSTRKSGGPREACRSPTAPAAPSRSTSADSCSCRAPTYGRTSLRSSRNRGSRRSSTPPPASPNSGRHPQTRPTRSDGCWAAHAPSSSPPWTSPSRRPHSPRPPNSAQQASRATCSRSTTQVCSPPPGTATRSATAGPNSDPRSCTPAAVPEPVCPGVPSYVPCAPQCPGFGSGQRTLGATEYVLTYPGRHRLPNQPPASPQPAPSQPESAQVSHSCGLGGTFRAGLRSKNPNGLSQNDTMSDGITGQSSGRVM